MLGPNGAGAATLCLQLNGILEPTNGSVSVGGLSVKGGNNLKEVSWRVGLVFQDPYDMLFMPTVAQDIAFGPSNLGLSEDEVSARVDRPLAAVGMEEVGGARLTTPPSGNANGSPPSAWSRR